MKHFVIERHTDAGFADCFEGENPGVGDIVGQHYPKSHPPRDGDPRWGYLYASESTAQSLANELNSCNGLGETAKMGRYIVAEFEPWRAK